MITLPAATPPATIKLFSSLGPRSAVVHAVLMLTQKSLPGSSDIGTSLTSFRLCDAAMATIANGAMQNTKPMNRIRCVKKLRNGVRSTMSSSPVVHAPLDEAELEDGKQDDEQHQDDALRGGTRIIQTFEAVGIDLVDHQIGRIRGAAGGHDIDDAEGILEAFGYVDDQKEEDRRRDQRELDIPETPDDARTVHCGGLDQRAGYGLECGEEEDEVVADIFPREGDDDRRHGIRAIKTWIPDPRPHPVDDGKEPRLRRQDEAEGQRQGRRGDAIGPDQHHAIQP